VEVVAAAMGSADDGNDPQIVARRRGSGHWCQPSFTAVPLAATISMLPSLPMTS
jgi:hypothetical protein